MEKDFASWHKLKTGLQQKKAPPFFPEREVWWWNIWCCNT
jgi:hypothetical protein